MKEDITNKNTSATEKVNSVYNGSGRILKTYVYKTLLIPIY